MKKLSKVWICPTCGNQFMAYEARDGLRAGRTCENGHFHSYYDYARFEQGKPISQERSGTKRTYKARNTMAVPATPGVSNSLEPTQSERDWYLAMLWVGAYDRLMSQLPRGVVRGMVEGALETAYKVSKKIVDKQQVVELRKAA